MPVSTPSLDDGPTPSSACVVASSPAPGFGVHKRGLSFDGDSPRDAKDSPHSATDITTPNTIPEDQRTKKRRTGPGSRGVANLTPEQLAKKRANDREAQRAIRERTKNQIETLERRIRELTSQQPYVELQAALRAKDAVEAENTDLKNRLSSILALIQPVLSTQSAEGVYASPDPGTSFASAQAGPGPSVSSVQNVSTPRSLPSPTSADSSWQAGVNSAASSIHASPHVNQVQLLSQQRHELVHGLDLGAGGEQLKLDFLLDPGTSQGVNRMQTGVNGAQDSHHYQHLPMKHDWSVASLPGSRRGSLAPAELAHSQPQVEQHRIDYAPRSNAESWAGYLTSIKNCAPTCPLDSILIDFLQERRQRAAEGVSVQEVVGPRYPSVSSLLNPATSVYSHPLSKVFTDILAKFPAISALPERVAVLYIMFLIMRWQISPTREHFDRLPEWVQPQRSQIEVPHPAWIDHLPFPRMREKIAREYNPQEYLFENFFIPFTTTICLNWPYEQTDTLLQSPEGEELMINPVFERHLRRLENWTLGEAFNRAFPQLEGTYNLKRDGNALPRRMPTPAAAEVARRASNGSY